jgi:hypothetical protein
MPIAVKDTDDLRRYLIEAATVLGTRFLFGPMPTGKKTDARWHDAWFDASIPGLLKLNCFFQAPKALFEQVKKTQWSPIVNQNVYRAPKYNSALRRQDKGVNGTVICNGDAAPASLAVVGCSAPIRRASTSKRPSTRIDSTHRRS